MLFKFSMDNVTSNLLWNPYLNSVDLAKNFDKVFSEIFQSTPSDIDTLKDRLFATVPILRIFEIFDDGSTDWADAIEFVNESVYTGGSSSQASANSYVRFNQKLYNAAGEQTSKLYHVMSPGYCFRDNWQLQEVDGTLITSGSAYANTTFMNLLQTPYQDGYYQNPTFYINITKNAITMYFTFNKGGCRVFISEVISEYPSRELKETPLVGWTADFHLTKALPNYGEVPVMLVSKLETIPVNTTIDRLVLNYGRVPAVNKFVGGELGIPDERYLVSSNNSQIGDVVQIGTSQFMLLPVENRYIRGEHMFDAVRIKQNVT